MAKHITGYAGLPFMDKVGRDKIQALEDNQIQVDRDDTSIIGIDDTVHDALETDDKRIIGGINEVNKKVKDNINYIDFIKNTKINCVRIDVFKLANETDYNNSLIRALNFAKTNNINSLYIPSGTYNINANNDYIFEIPSNFTIFGEGDISIIEFNDNPEVSLTWNNSVFKSTNKENITLKNFKIRGSLNKYPTYMQQNSLPFINIDKCQKIIVDNVSLEGNRGISAQIGNCKDVKIINSSVKNSLRDGFRCVNSSNVTIDNNYFYNVGDDCITVSSVNTVDDIPSNTIITNNIIVMSQGVKALGGKNITISNNQFKLCHNTAISVCNILSGEEGLDIPLNLIISNNIIQDHLRFKEFGEGALVVDVIGPSKTKIDNKIIGMTKAPYEYTWSKNSSNKGAFDNIIFSNNIIARTLPTTSKISDYGYGTILLRSSTTPYNDLEITDDTFSLFVTQFKNCINNLIFDNNIISGYNGTPLVFSSDYTGVSLENISIKNNIFRDNKSSQISFVNNIKKNNCIIESNTFDVDPYFRNPAHNEDNTWNSELTGSISNGIAGYINDTIVRKNVFKNCYLPYAGSPLLNLENYSYRDSSTNKGVGVKGTTTSIEVDCDPVSDNYMQINNS